MERSEVQLIEATNPIGKIQLGLDDIIRKNLKLRIKLDSVGYARSTKTKYRTDLKMQYRDDDFSYLSDKVVKIIGDYAKERLYTSNCWGIIYNQNEESKPHTHPKSVWSWIYYIDCCENCSPLVFTKRNIEVKPNIDQLILFNGDDDLNEHAVFPQKCEHERVIISGNIEYVDGAPRSDSNRLRVK